MTSLTYNGLTLIPANGYLISEGEGFNGLPPRISEANLTAKPGGNVFARQQGMRTIILQGRVFGATVDEYFTRKNALLSAFNMYADDTLVATLWNGATLSIDAKVVEEPMIVYTSGVATYGDFRVALRCPNPYWRANAAITATLYLPDIIGFDFPFDFPFDIAFDTSLSEVTIDNTGDAISYPKFTINGAAGLINPTITNLTTGQFIQINTTVTSGQQVIIQYTQSGASVKREDGSNYFQYVIGEVFPLEPGNNVISFTASDNTVDGSVDIEFYPRYGSF